MKNYTESIEISKGISELFNIYESNMIELSKLLNEATNYVKDELGLSLWYGQAGPRSQAGWYEKLQPKKYAHSVFYNNKINNEDNTDPNKSDWLIILMILLKENIQNVNQECISLSLLHYNCLNNEGNRLMGNEWEYQAIISMKRKDWCKYSVSEWSKKVLKAVRNDYGNISYFLNIPVGYFEGADDFPILLKPCINALLNKNENEIKEINLYLPDE